MAQETKDKASESWLITYQSRWIYTYKEGELMTTTLVIREHPARWLLEFKKNLATAVDKAHGEPYVCFEALLFALPLHSSGLTEAETTELEKYF